MTNKMLAHNLNDEIKKNSLVVRKSPPTLKEKRFKSMQQQQNPHQIRDSAEVKDKKGYNSMKPVYCI